MPCRTQKPASRSQVVTRVVTSRESGVRCRDGPPRRQTRLVALFDPEHTDHAIAHSWFANRREEGWAPCPITEKGGWQRLAPSPRTFAQTRGGIARLFPARHTMRRLQTR